MENNKNHILIVDDDDRIRNLLKDYLSENNYIVSTAENADQAKEKLLYLKFDILINKRNKKTDKSSYNTTYCKRRG
jgi:two-component system phosphate regulon response regulator OmpR